MPFTPTCPTDDGRQPFPSAFADLTAISPLARNQLVTAERLFHTDAYEDRNKFWNLYLRPHLLDEARDIHVCLAPKKEYGAHRHEHAATMLRAGADDQHLQAFTQLFAHPMRLPQWIGDHWGPRPTERLTNAGFAIQTFEVDSPLIEMFETQMGWCRSAGKKTVDSPIGRVDQMLKRFHDFRGIAVVYSGNRSLHIHTIWDTRHLSRALSDAAGDRQLAAWQGDLSDADFQRLYRSVWEELAVEIKQVLQLEGEFDAELSRMSQLRRLPWGTRLAGADGKPNALGIPDETLVTQCVLYDTVRVRAPKSADEWLFAPAKVQQQRKDIRNVTARLSDRGLADAGDPRLIETLQEYCEQVWRRLYPRPVAAHQVDGEWRVYFQNSPGDQNPSSVMAGDHNTVLIHSRDPNVLGGQSFAFDLPVDDVVAMLLKEIRENRKQPGPAGYLLGAHFLSKQFTQRATDISTARASLEGITGLMKTRPLVLLGVEGVGKSRNLMRSLPYERLDKAIKHAGDPRGFLAFSCLSYEQARAKCEEFNALHADGSFIGKVLPSFSRLYGEACEKLGVKKMSPAAAAKSGARTFVQAVRERQPSVYAEMLSLKQAIWGEKSANFDPLYTVVFTVHALVQNWGRESNSRLWMHPDAEAHLGNKAQEDRLRQEMMISDVIHDEITFTDFIDIESRSLVEWAWGVRRSISYWERAGLAEQYRAYEAAVKPDEMTFDHFRKILKMDFRKKDLVAVDAAKAPFGVGRNNLYLDQHGAEFYLRARHWRSALGARIVYLTTEELPTRVAQAVYQGEGKGLSVLDLRFPKELPNSAASVWVTKLAKAAGLRKLVERLRADEPDLFLITDGRERLELANACTLVSSRGRNDLSDRDIATIIMPPHPDQYAKLALIADACGIDGIMPLAYRDVIQQAVARNSGYRYSGYGHLVVINNHLFRDLGGDAFAAGGRYKLERTCIKEAA